MKLAHQSPRSLLFVQQTVSGPAALHVVRACLHQRPGFQEAWLAELLERPLQWGEAFGREPVPWERRPWVEGVPLARLRPRLRARAELLLPAQVVELALPIARELDLWHARGRVHGRLDAEHVILTPSGRIELLGRLAGGPPLGDLASLAELSTMAPEQLLQIGAHPSTDRYRLALLVLEQLVGGSPLTRSTRELTARRVFQGLPEALVPGLGREGRLFLRACLHPDPEQRPTGRLLPAYKAMLAELPEQERGLGRTLQEHLPKLSARQERRVQISLEAEQLRRLLLAAPLEPDAELVERRRKSRLVQSS